MGKKNRKGKENNAAKTSFLKVENIKNTNSGLELPSQDYTNVEEKESSPKTDFPLITKEHVNTKTDSNILDYPTIGDLVSSVEKLLDKGCVSIERLSKDSISRSR
ncbi:CBK_G0011370.mRNA.1.CDS.1 [Saccharomyces cerevisiae]|nr:CBK_G0011370.mRNA.1.CDS.1 [Saccharomyces cerevisiae]CAI7214607.1 CBK_G0011370.mRNA.1.CDS.1 [Saccharomyces cerevisiae]